MNDLELLITYTNWLNKNYKDGCLGYNGNNVKFPNEFIYSEEYKQLITNK